MGKELEYKLAVASEELLDEILRDAELPAHILQETRMKTTYFDTPDRRLSAQHITLRQRFEGDKSIVCVKIPTKDAHTRGEWQIESETVDEKTIFALVELGAPKELVYFVSSCDLVPSCSAEFLRRHAMLTFSDGSQAEIAGDRGVLRGKEEVLPFTELELELYSGEKKEMLALLARLCEKYGLREEPRSKYARARSLK
jgi:inorganic triphosphatase YgiF